MAKSKSVSNALYTIHVPTHDPSGRELVNLTQQPYADFTKLRRMVHDVHSEGPHEGNPYRHLKVLAVDNPQVDTHVKSLAQDIGRLSGHQAIFIHKHGDSGHQPWSIANVNSTGQPDPSALAPVLPPVPAPQATVAPASYQTNP